MRYEFLSSEWIDAARAIRDEYRDRLPTLSTAVAVNLRISDAPDGRTVEAHLDTSSGQPALELGLLPAVDVTLSLEYETARAAFVSQDQAAVMQALMSGKVKVEGDLSKLLAMQVQQAQAGPLAAEVFARVKDVTLE